MFDKILGTVLLMCCAAEILTIVFKLIQPDCVGRLLGALLIPVNGHLLHVPEIFFMIIDAILHQIVQ